MTLLAQHLWVLTQRNFIDVPCVRTTVSKIRIKETTNHKTIDMIVCLRSLVKWAYVCNYRAVVVLHYYLNELGFTVLQANNTSVPYRGVYRLLHPNRPSQQTVGPNARLVQTQGRGRWSLHSLRSLTPLICLWVILNTMWKGSETIWTCNKDIFRGLQHSKKWEHWVNNFMAKCLKNMFDQWCYCEFQKTNLVFWKYNHSTLIWLSKWKLTI